MSHTLRETMMRLAIDEAHKCIPTPTAFCVGCVLVVRWPETASAPVILATGYSRELPGNTHAEANALSKARSLSPDEVSSILSLDSSSTPPAIDELLKATEVYTTMEPCSVRTSGLAPCADALVSAQVRECIIGVDEPADFVVCEGAQKLKDAGIDVIWLKGVEEECLQVARKGH